MISPKRLLLTVGGTVVEDGDPAGEFLLVGQGCYIADAVARRHGLLPAEPDGPAPVAGSAEITAGNASSYAPQSTGDPLQDLLVAKRAENALEIAGKGAPTSQDLGVTQAEAENGAEFKTAPALVAVPADADAEAITVDPAEGAKAAAPASDKAVTSAADKAVSPSSNK